VALAATGAGAVVAGLTHPARDRSASNLFVIALNFRHLLTVECPPCLTFAIPVLLYAYFAATDDWRNIVAQML
jgi:hypothetical protein